MKKCLVLTLITAALVLVCASALAWTDHEMPKDISDYFSTKNFDGCQIMDYTDLSNHGTYNSWFVLIRDGRGANILYVFKKDANGVWKHQFHNSGAVPQTKHDISCHIIESGTEGPTHAAVERPLLIINRMDATGIHEELTVIYELRAGYWYLHRIFGSVGYNHMLVREGKITYYKGGMSTETAGSAEGTIQRDIRYVSLPGIPKTLAEARSSLTVAPTLPASSELKVYPVNFTGAKKYDVYSAPDKSSVRGANGKAAVSTNGWIQVFGTEGDWVLIQYSIDVSHYRFGYISTKSLPKKASVPALNFQRTLVWTTGTVNLTDDPLYSRAAIASLPQNTQVTWLASMGEWAYVEVRGATYARGFIPLAAITSNIVSDLYTKKDGNGRAVFDGTLTVDQQGWLELSAGIAADGPLAGVTVSQIQVKDSTGGILTTLYQGSDGRFYGNCAVSAGDRAVTMEAIDEYGFVVASIRADW